MNTIHTAVEAAIQRPPSPPPDSLDESGAVEVNTQPKLDELVEQIVRAHLALHAATQTVVDRALELGGLLIQAKNELQHGDFGAWIEANFKARTGLSQRTANVYMFLRSFADEYPNQRDELTARTLTAAVEFIRERQLSSNSQGAANMDQIGENAPGKAEGEAGDGKANQTTSDGADKEATVAQPRKSVKVTTAQRGKARSERMRSMVDVTQGFMNALLNLADMIKNGRAPTPTGWKVAPLYAKQREAVNVIVAHLAPMQTGASEGEAH